MCSTFLAIYVFAISIRIVVAAFDDIAAVVRVSPLHRSVHYVSQLTLTTYASKSERTAFHAVFLALYSAIFALSTGSFCLWHVYLITYVKLSLW